MEPLLARLKIDHIGRPGRAGIDARNRLAEHGREEPASPAIRLRNPDEVRGPYHLIPLSEAGSAERLLVFRRGERGAPVAGLRPLQKWLAEMEPPLVEPDPNALSDAGIDMEVVRRAARSDRWLARCERFPVRLCRLRGEDELGRVAPRRVCARRDTAAAVRDGWMTASDRIGNGACLPAVLRVAE